MPAGFFAETGKLSHKLRWHFKEHRITKAIFKKEEQNRMTHMSGLQNVLQTVLTIAVWSWCENHWRRIEHPEVNPYDYGHLIFNKVDEKTLQEGKDCLTNGSEKLSSHT